MPGMPPGMPPTGHPGMLPQGMMPNMMPGMMPGMPPGAPPLPPGAPPGFGLPPNGSTLQGSNAQTPRGGRGNRSRSRSSSSSRGRRPRGGAANTGSTPVVATGADGMNAGADMTSWSNGAPWHA